MEQKYQAVDFIELTSDCIMYPIGETITFNIPIVKNMGNALLSKYPADTRMVFWCMGSSGAIMAALISQIFENKIISHVKKTGECSHSCKVTPSILNYKDYIHVIIDDFMCTGDTVNDIISEMTTREIKVDVLIISDEAKIDRLDKIPTLVIANEITYNNTEIILNRIGKF